MNLPVKFKNFQGECFIMKIALVDTGVNKSHPQLRNYNIVNYQIETQGGKVAIKKGERMITAMARRYVELY